MEIEILQKRFNNKPSIDSELFDIELDDKPFLVINESGIIVYYEILWREFAIEHKELSFELQILLMLYRPFTYYMLSLRKTYSELYEFNRSIIEFLQSKNIHSASSEKLRRIVNLNKPNLETISTIAYFHYFINFEFESSNIGIDRDKLSKIRPNGCIFVNPCFNDPYNIDSTFIYRLADSKLGTQLLTTESIDKFSPIAKVECIKTKERAWIDGHLEDDGNGLVIQYSNDIFTLSSTLLTKSQAMALLEGAIQIPFTNDRITHYIQMERLRLLGRQLTYPSNKPTVFTNLSEITWQVLTPVWEAHKSSFAYKQFIDDIIERIRDMGLMFESDLKVFSVYLSLYSGNTTNLNFTEFHDYIRTYITKPI